MIVAFPKLFPTPSVFKVSKNGTGRKTVASNETERTSDIFAESVPMEQRNSCVNAI